MIRYIEFPAEQTAEIAKRIANAGEGAVLRVVPEGNDDGTAVKYSIAIRSAAQKAARTNDEDCEPNVNKSGVCPPTC